jgi:glyceraldehyde 3-phosphate dehydrogenase
MSRVQIIDDQPPVLGINGLGRIGKLTLWHHIARKYFKEIVVNQGREIGRGLHDIAHTIEKDSTYGLMHTFLHGINALRMIKIEDEANGKLRIDDIPVTILQEARNPKDIPWRDYNAEVVVECTGTFRDPTAPPDDAKGSIRGHLMGGAKVVLNSSAFKIENKALSMPEDVATLIYGINHHAFDPQKHLVVSAASCTTTGLAHMVKPLLEHAETNTILTASMSTVHAATNIQSVLDSVPKAGEKDLRKNRSILNNIILTSTNAAEALAQVITEVHNIGFMADSIRIPTSTESLIVLNVTFQSRMDSEKAASTITADTINEIYRKASEDDPEHLLVYSDEQNVSSDVTGINAAVVIEGQFNHTRTAFLTVDLSQIPNIPQELQQAISGQGLQVPVVHAKVFGWYDNEYGSYTNRLGDLTVHVHKMLTG